MTTVSAIGSATAPSSGAPVSSDTVVGDAFAALLAGLVPSAPAVAVSAAPTSAGEGDGDASAGGQGHVTDAIATETCQCPVIPGLLAPTSVPSGPTSAPPAPSAPPPAPPTRTPTVAPAPAPPTPSPSVISVPAPTPDTPQAAALQPTAAEAAVPDVPPKPATPGPAPAPAPDNIDVAPPAAPTPTHGATTGDQPKRDDAPAPSPAATTPPPTTPQQPAAAPLTREVPLHRAAHTVSHVLHVAQAQGVSRARLTLRPAELGGIEIRLTTDAAGVTATVTADSPQAAQLLQDAAADLRRSLERSGVTVADLQIGARDGSGAAHQDASDGSRRGHGGTGGPATDADADSAPQPIRTLTLPDGVLVDVLA